MRNLKIAAAVAATLVGGSAFALPANTASYGVNLVVSGSSAFKVSFKAVFPTMCADTADLYTAAATSGATPDMLAMSCTLKNDGTLPAAIAGKTAIAYYRSEGGSVFGVGPIAKNVQIDRLVVNSSCTGTNHSFTCPVANWNLNADTGTGNLVKDTTLLGISDVEPAQFIGGNWPSGTLLGVQPTPAQLANITNIQSAIAQVFAIYVNKSVTGGSSTTVSISKQSLTSIFNGFYTDWSQVPKADGSGFFSAGAINVCNRDVGSGTRAGAGIYFEGVGCSTAPYQLISTPTINASTGAEISCIGGTAGSVGYANIQNLPVSAGGTSALPANTSIVWIDGVEPSPLTAATGNYDYWFEATFNSGSALASHPVENAMATYLIGRLQDATTLPGTTASPSVIALPVGVNVPTLPQADNSHPVAIGSRSGNSCQAPVGFN
ncbi:MAG TPA: hypothetical protein VG962_07470 [Steroidobacteraceae bacterium]|nr:hypothetical protein [Steroidobacteraceae bacterium]